MAFERPCGMTDPEGKDSWDCYQNEMVFSAAVWYTETNAEDLSSDIERGGLEWSHFCRAWIWLGAVILFGVLELATAGLVSIWFVAGALAALAGAVLGAELLVQVLLFAGVSAAALAVTRPLVRKYTRRDTVATNADRVLGSRAKVTETIDNDNSTGAVYVDGKTWTARSAEGDVIPAGEQVEVASIEGVKLLVIPVKEGGFVK